ncbi:hypothetical protein ACHAXT_010103 [Thalassiosira profunda]
MPKPKAAVLQRARRSTAGKRMSSLVGQAQDDDDAFWSHSIWSETGGGFSDKGSRKRRRDEGDSSSSSESDGSDEGSVSDGEGSFRMSDEDSAEAVDQFDSDFDESESEEEVDNEEERELLAEERRAKASKRKKNQRLGVPKRSSAGRDLMGKKKTGKMTKRGPLGEGWNQGLVLNWPPPTGAVAPVAGAKPAMAPASPPPGGLNSVSAVVPVPGARASAAIPAALPIQPQYIPPKPAGKPALRTGAPSAPPAIGRPKQSKPVAPPAKKKPAQPKITQEEMILESIQSTETDNSKWLNARKRSKEEAAQLEKAAAAGKAKSSLHQKPVSRFYSRRGRTNTLTFMDMDQLPEILTRKSARPRGASTGSPHSSVLSPRRKRSASETSAPPTPEVEKKQEKCAITGKVARYRDPKTKLGYYDVDAYKELKRRIESGEMVIPKAKTKAKPKPAPKKQKKMNGPSEGMTARANAGKGTINLGATKSHVPLQPGKPTLVAARAPPAADVKVRVTQGGCPVSPPFRIHLRVPGKTDKKEPPSFPTVVGSSDKANGGRTVAKGNTVAKSSSAAPGVGKAAKDSDTAKEESPGELQSESFSEGADSAKARKPEAAPNGESGETSRDVGAKGTFALAGIPAKPDVAKEGATEEKQAKAPPKGVSTRRGGKRKAEGAPEIPTRSNKRTTIEAN